MVDGLFSAESPHHVCEVPGATTLPVVKTAAAAGASALPGYHSHTPCGSSHSKCASCRIHQLSSISSCRASSMREHVLACMRASPWTPPRRAVWTTWRTSWCGTLSTARSCWRASARCEAASASMVFVMVQGGRADAGPCVLPKAGGARLQGVKLQVPRWFLLWCKEDELMQDPAYCPKLVAHVCKV
eukprot:1156248-Pelagomonas_calceolata.AAC.5